MKKTFIAFAVLLLIIVGFGCDKEIGSKPDDFSFEYNWQEGSLPPPYHFEYTITVTSDGVGVLTYVPDYSGNSTTPIWTEPLPTVSQEELQVVYEHIARTGLFRTGKLQKEDKSVGGSYAWLEVTSNNAMYEIGVGVQDDPVVQELYQLINQIVLQQTWEKMRQQRQQYMQDEYEVYQEIN